MVENAKILSIIANGEVNELLNGISDESANIIRNKINEIPDSFFSAKFEDNLTQNSGISLIEFSMRTISMSSEKRNGYMARYNIDPNDFSKLQSIVNSIQVASEYGRVEVADEKEKQYGISLSDSQTLDRAYPLWLAYLYADSKNPYDDITSRLIADGKDNKYDASYIVGLIEHNNSLMSGRNSEEKKDFYLQTISGILEDGSEINTKIVKNSKDEIEV